MPLSSPAGNPLLPEPSGVLDLAAVAQVRDLMEEEYAALLRHYLEDSARYVTGIEAALRTADMATVASAAHTLKSSSRQMGALQLSRVAEAMERIAGTAESDKAAADDIAGRLPELRDSLTCTQNAFAALP